MMSITAGQEALQDCRPAPNLVYFVTQDDSSSQQLSPDQQSGAPSAPEVSQSPPAALVQLASPSYSAVPLQFCQGCYSFYIPTVHFIAVHIKVLLCIYSQEPIY